MSCFREPNLSSVTLRHLSIVCILVFTLSVLGCRSTGRDSGIVLTVIDQGWPGSEPRLGPELEEYTRQTGIRVQILPAPEAAVEQLATWRELLEAGQKYPMFTPSTQSGLEFWRTVSLTLSLMCQPKTLLCIFRSSLLTIRSTANWFLCPTT